MTMVQRVFLSKSPPRLITSKAGKNATPTMADADKSFDSNWLDGGGLKWVLKLPTSTSAVTFPYQLNYIPYVWGFSAVIWNGNKDEFDPDWFATNGLPTPPTNGCVLCAPSVQLDGQVVTVSQSGISAPVSGAKVSHWLVFEG
jgi:hypothetical protein